MAGDQMKWVSSVSGWDFREEMGYYGVKRVQGVYHAYSIPALFAKPEFIGSSDDPEQAKRICEIHRERV